MADADFSVKAIISAQTSQFEKGMKNAQSSVNSLSNSINNITNLVKKAFAFTGVALGTKAIVDFGKSSIKSANQAIKTFNILDNTVKATGADAWTSIGELENASKALSDSTNYSVTEIQNMQSVLLGFTNITGEAFDGASEAVLDMATVMGMDLTSAVQTVGKALDDPITGLDSLRRQGFKFTDEQKAELAQLVRNGEQLKAQKIILDTLAISYGDASKAGQDSFAKQRHAMENLMDTLGGKLIPLMQVFAEDNAKVLDALREKIEQMDFSKTINVVTNLKNIFVKRFEEIKQRVVIAKDSIVDFLKRFNFGPIVSIIDTLIGHLVETVKMFREMQGLNFGSLKEGLIELSNSEAFEKFAIFFNTIVDVSHGILEEVKKAWPEIRDAIVNVIINIWDKIKEFFEKVDNALNGSGNSLHLWADLFWKELDNIYRIAQDLLKGVTHLLKGDWATAWEYAKLAVLRVADGVLDAISTIANGMPKIINKIIGGWNRVLGWINKELEKLNKDPIDLVPEFKSVDLSDVTGVTDKIEEVEKKIQELTGATADNGISHLDRLSGKWKGFTSSALGNIEALTEGAEDNTEKQKQDYTETFNSMETTGELAYEKFSEWELKLRNQRLEGLKEYSAEYHEITLQAIEEERKKALEEDKTGIEKDKINKYYNKEIEKENKRHFKAVMGELGLVVKGFKNAFSKIASFVKNTFSKIADFIKNTFSKIGSLVSSAWGKFKKIIKINLDDAIETLLVFEDSILTFFVETLPQLPSFLDSVLQSIGVLLDNIFGNMNLSKIISDVFQSLPAVVDKVVELFTDLFTRLTTAINTNMENIVSGIGNSILTIAEAVPNVINQVFSVINKLLEESQKYLENKKEDIKNAVVNIITSIVENLPETITNMLSVLNEVFDIVLGTIEELMPMILSVVEPILSNIFTTLGTWIVKSLPVILNAIIGLVNALIDSLPAIIETLLKMLPKIIQAVMDALPKLLGETIPKLLTTLIGLIPDIIKAALEAVVVLVKSLPKIVSSIITGLVKVFSEVNWGQLVLDIFGAFGNALIDFIATIPSYFSKLWQGIKDIFSGVGKWFSDVFSTAWANVKLAFTNPKEFFSNVWKNVKNGFGNVGEWFSTTFGNAWTNMKNAFSGARDWFSNLFNGIKTVVKNIWDGLVNIIKAPCNAIIKAINFVISGLNKFSFSIPDWVPFVGGKKFGINIPLVDELARGTQNARRGLTLVGEAGPELVRFNGGEEVLNNRDTQKALDGINNKTNNFNVTFNNLQDTTAYAMLQQLKQYNRQMAINSVF